ncbi:hypothetical protein Tco_1503073 [Tanacetum coccineum]
MKGIVRWDARPDLLKCCGIEAGRKTMQEAIEMATELMDRRINTLLRDRQKIIEECGDPGNLRRTASQLEEQEKQGNGNAVSKPYARSCRAKPNNNGFLYFVTGDWRQGSKKKQLQGVLYRSSKIFPKYFPRNWPGLPPIRQVEFTSISVPGALHL